MRSINLGRWSRRVERYFNIKGGGGLMDVDQSVNVSLPIASGNEDRILEDWNRYALEGVVSGGAGQNAAMMIRNPVGSNAVAVVERIGGRVTAATLSIMQVSFTPSPTTDLPTILGPSQALDRRVTKGSVLILSTSTNATNLTIIISGAVTGGTEYAPISTVNQEITLLPGSSLQILDATVAETLTASFMWRERGLEASELTF